ncbi:MAG: glycoside hydrolase family 3 N-terminal domain-containing protein [Bacteroidota bacterium]
MKYFLLILLFVQSTAFARQMDESSGIDSLDIHIGQMIMIGIGDRQVFEADDAFLLNLQKGYVGGIIFYEKNINRKNPKRSLQGMVKGFQMNSQIPLFVSIDEEGGRVNRLKEKYGFNTTRSAAWLSQQNNLDTTRAYTLNAVSNMYEVGINLNYAPDVDLAVNPDNPVIAKVERSFGATADKVIPQAKEVIAVHHLMGVGTVLKHFPGHGSSKSDTHFGVADVTDFWQFEELRPYKALLDSGVVDGIMTAHIVNANLDPRKLPATLSDKVITGILRDFLKFDGVVFSDDMQMHAISKQYGFENAVKMAILAGVDVLMFANNVPGFENVTVRDLHGLIREMVDAGEISPQRIRESYNRVIRLKGKMGLTAPGYLEKLNARLK